jgi:Zn-dependent M28 family amino/carboxypeptidase
LQAITEGKMVIKAIHFSSTHSDNVEYTINLSDNLEVFKDDKKSKVLPWWHRADITVSDYFDSKGEHAVEEIETWEELGLGWTESLASSDTEAEILDIRAFKPEVIQGGRD